MNLIKTEKKHYNKGKNNPMWGRHHSEETRRKMSIAGKGRKLTEIHKTKISEAKKGKERLRGKDSANWKGGKKMCGGYVLIWKPSHPYSNKGGYVRRSRLVAEQVLGRYLKKEEIVHHKNKERSDDKKYNLIVCNQAYHLSSFHVHERKRDRRGRFLAY